MGYIGVITHLLTIDPNFQRDIQGQVFEVDHFGMWKICQSDSAKDSFEGPGPKNSTETLGWNFTSVKPHENL